jgi:hypothetical protein
MKLRWTAVDVDGQSVVPRSVSYTLYLERCSLHGAAPVGRGADGADAASMVMMA